jgi:hypothetical protein
MPRVSTARCVWTCAFIVLCLAAGEIRAATADDKDPLVELPPVNVTADRPLPEPESWRYARVPGLEILSDTSERETRLLVRDLQLFNSALDVVWPGLKNRSSVPLTLILGGSPKNFATFLPVNSVQSAYSRAGVTLRSSEQAVIALNVGNKLVLLNLADADVPGADPRAPYGTFASASTPGDDDLRRLVDHHQQLQREYVHYLLSVNGRELPVWLQEGLSRLLMKMKVDPKFIEFAKVEDPNLAPAGYVDGMGVDGLVGGALPAQEHDFNRTLATKGLIPFPEFFAVTRDSPEANSSIAGKWSRQAEALVHMWLYGEGKRFNAGFAKFVERSMQEPVTEALFKECFKMSYADMLGALRMYVTTTAYSYKLFTAGKGGGLPEPAPLALRDATEAEVGRIKGEAQILAGHAETARETMITPYLRGERDPALLASLGLVEKQLGDTERARKFLEVAAQKQVVRPRAYVALSELRLAEAQPAPDGPPLTATQTQAVLQPLLAARTQRPAIPELYELMADVWLRSAATPAPDDLALLNQAVDYFRLRPVLLLRVAELNGRYGDPVRARSLAELGAKFARTPEAKRAFEDVIASLPPAKAK